MEQTATTTTTGPRARDEDGNGERNSPFDGMGGIEASLAVLHQKMNKLVEDAAVARTEIAWLKWGMRLLFAAILGVGGVAAHAVV